MEQTIGEGFSYACNKLLSTLFFLADDFLDNGLIA
jgi:hypothetical protein